MAKRKKKKNKNMKPGTNPHAAKQRQIEIEQNVTAIQIIPETVPGANAPSNTQSLAQKRAKHALDAIENIDNSYDKYVSYVKALPADIIMSGLGQAMAMLKSGKKPGHEILFGHMQNWLCNGWQHGPYSNFDDILKAITNDDKTEDDYIRAQAEAMLYLEWLKKFAVAFLKSGNETVGADDDAN